MDPGRVGNSIKSVQIQKWNPIGYGAIAHIYVDLVTSMLVTDIGDQMSRWQVQDVGDSFGQFGHQNPLSFYITVEHQHSKDVTNVQKIVANFKSPIS